MPRRLTIHHAVSPHSSVNTVNEVIGTICRKWASQHVEKNKIQSLIRSRRSSTEMDHVLPLAKKEKKRENSHGRESKKKGPLSIRPHHSKHPSTTSPALRPSPAGSFKMIMESPPAILYGPASTSNGAIVAGRLKLDVTDPSGELTLTNFNMILQVSTRTKRPVSKDCPDCAVKHEIIKTWNFLSEPMTFVKIGDNQFPWSHMLEGRLPTTSDCIVGSISYTFVVTATTSLGETLTMTHPLEVKRAIPPGPEKTSIRIFPPTNLTGKATMPSIVHPIGKFPVQMSLSGIVDKKEASQTRWRLKKMMWRIEEHCTIKSSPCDRHRHKVSEGKAIQTIDSKQLGDDEMKSGWKTDFDTAGGEITLEFEAQVATKASHKPCCDVDSQSGLDVRHNLVIELIVAEEFVPSKNTSLITPTGAARVLRMQFALTVSERAGMGISWEEEMPPVYDDVPPSPPGYRGVDRSNEGFGGAIMEDYDGPHFEYFDLERVPTASGPPVYRERDAATLNDSAAQATSDIAEPSGYGENQLRQRLGGFRLDELEAEPPQFSSRDQQDSSEGNDGDQVDYAEGDAGNTTRRHGR